MASTIASVACSTRTKQSAAAQCVPSFSTFSTHRNVLLAERIASSSLHHLSGCSSRVRPSWPAPRPGRRTFIVQAARRLAEVEAAPFVDKDGKPTEFPSSSGIYAVYDMQGELQFVGLSRRLATSLQFHLLELPELCGSVKVDVIDAPERAALAEAWQAWMQEHIDATGKVPAGNVQGNTTWTDRKVKRVKADLKLTPGPNTKLNISLEELLETVVKSSRVVAFIKGSRSSPQCGFSHKLITILNEQAVDYDSINVLDDIHNAGVREAIKTYSNWPTIPQLYVNGEFVGGTDVLEEMVASGEIKSLFK